jgi:hypothetical protein
MKNLTSIAMLTCWYGYYPWCFSYYVHSYSFNPIIVFHVITDNLDEIPNKPDNLIIINKKLAEIKKIVSQKMEFNVSLDCAYKLNDFKPAYGFLFPELFQGYDCNVQSDLDIIYGNIRGFLTEEMFNSYNYLSMRHDITTGHFSLYRNNEKMNTFFMKNKDYKSVLSNYDSCYFDECGKLGYAPLAKGKSIFEYKSDIMSFTHLIKAAEITNDIKAHFDFILCEGNTGKIVFDNGRLIYNKKFEAIPYHLMYFKTKCTPFKVPKNIPNKYRISPTKIYPTRKSKKIES